ncbi:MAG: GTP-binding protein [Myxococcota bacterium]|nr:GTP-binding protein [Myxococcota bacterium]
MTNRLPITLLMGAPGTDGRKIYNRIVNDREAYHVTAISPWPRSKATQSQDNLKFVRTTEKLKRLGAGCSCCTVRGDVLSKVRQIFEAGHTDRLMLQVPPQSDLEALAKTFSVPDERGDVLGDIAVIDQAVTMIDGRKILQTLKTRSATLLTQMVRSSNSVWIDGADTLEPNQLTEVLGALKVMNPEADLVSGHAGAIKISEFAPQAAALDATAPQAHDISDPT